MFGLSLFRPSRQSNVSTSGKERFKYPLPWENKISQMPYPRVNKDNQIPTPCPDNFDLKDVKVRLFGVGRSTVNKIKQFDLANVSRFAPDVVILEIGTNDLCNEPPEKVDELVELFQLGYWSLSRCSDALLHLEYKLHLCELNIEFKKLREEKP